MLITNIQSDELIFLNLTTRYRETFTNEDGTPFSLTGRKIFIRLVNADTTTGTEPVVTLGIGSGVVVEGAGVFSWAVTPAQVTELTGDAYVNVYLTILEADDTLVLSDSYKVRKSW
jgi:hypothetical protein